MKPLLKIFPLFLLPVLLLAKPEKIALQEIDGVENKEGAWIHLHRPAKPNGATAIICPGGGYGGLVMGAERPSSRSREPKAGPRQGTVHPHGPRVRGILSPL